MFRRLLLIAATAAIPAAALAAEKPSLMPIEPVDIPPSVEQGVEMIYIDPEIAPAVRERDALLAGLTLDEAAGTPVDLFLPAHPIYTELRRALVRYRMNWGGLPAVSIPDGPTLRQGGSGERVALLRERLGLSPGDSFDDALARKVAAYQAVHGLKADGVAGGATIASLNLGPDHYERLLKLNLERAQGLPTAKERERYVLVDVGAARIDLFENGKVVDSMKAIVGDAETPTPMMAALIRYASVNPYWNVPPELVQSLIAPRVVAQGLTYLEEREYQVLSDWSDDPELIDPASVDWVAVAEGRENVRLRRLPSPANSMGRIKFMMPNAFGIYLHDTPNKAPFADDDRWISNGCIRVEDAERLATWLFGEMPQGHDPKVEEQVELEKPVPVYITYLTVDVSPQGIVFRDDPYRRDSAVLARQSVKMASSF